ncbi:MAG: GntR family transcriptional regulator [Planctomycetaceae bacterium]|nr:GntR family transcriptional regulator [Planctomycetaceae bacterium]
MTDTAEISSTPRSNGSAPAASFPPRELLKDRAYDQLKARILDNDYPPGSFLAERQLADQLGMSKTPIKAALERLEHEGFIAVSPQQGIVVRDLAVAEIADQYEIRVALESYTLRTIAGRLSPQQTERIENNLAAQEAILGQANIARGVALDAEFHTLFAEALGNQEILRVMKQLREKMQRVITRVFQINPSRIDTSYAEHRAIAEAAIRGDGGEAVGLIEQHLDRGRQLILSPRRG